MRHEIDGVEYDSNLIYGPLPDWAIAAAIQEGIINIDPLPTTQDIKTGPLTIDFHMGSKLLVPRIDIEADIDPRQGVNKDEYEEIELQDGEFYRLLPNQYICAETLETLTLPDNIKGVLDGRSSYARLGIVVHLTAGRFDPGWGQPIPRHPILELHNANERRAVRLYKGAAVCAFGFERLMAPVENTYRVNGRYTDGTIQSLVHK